MTTILVESGSVADIIAQVIYNNRFIYKIFKRRAIINNNYVMYVFFDKDYNIWKDMRNYIDTKY